MRVLLIVNPAATAADPASTRRAETSLAAVAKVDVERTTHRGHAHDLAAQAHVDGLDAVAVLGGDGTVAEVVSGLLSRGVVGDVPGLGVVPGGATNVLARILGMSRRPAVAAEQLAAGIRAGRSRRIGLGHLRLQPADDGPAVERYFVLNVGLGLDAAAIARVEAARRRGHRATSGRYALATAQAWRTSDRATGPLTVRTPSGCAEGLAGAIVANTDPWSYLGARRLRPTPTAAFDLGLDVAASRGLGLLSTVTAVGRMLVHRPAPLHQSWGAHDEPWVQVDADRPVDLQADGDHLGTVRSVHLHSLPAALRVLIP